MSGKPLKLGAVVVVQNDAETIERSLASYYPYVEKILVSTDLKRGWSGVEIVPDDTIDRIRAMDTDNKIEIMIGDFYRYPIPMQNDTNQRQLSADRLCGMGSFDWIVQVDADEEFLDFPAVAERMQSLPERTASVSWRWIQLFQTLEDGRFLVVTQADGKPHLEQFAFAHRPGAKLDACRFPKLPIQHPRFRRWLGFEYVAPPTLDYCHATLHYSFAKSERRILEKLRTWSHSNEFDTEGYFTLWQNSKTDWQTMRNFHPTYPQAWHALRPFSLAELKTLKRTP